MPFTTVLVSFAGIFAVALASLLVARLLLHRLREGQLQEAWAEMTDSPLFKAERLSTISFWNRLLKRFDWVEIVKARTAEAGLQWSVGRLTAMMLLAGAAGAVVCRQISGLPPYLSVAVGGVMAAAPYLVVLRRRARRLRMFEEHFPDALDSLARALRAGNPLLAGLEMLARESPSPVSTEMRKTVEERNLGMSWDVALDHLATRVPISEISVFPAAVQLQMRSGGKLHEVLARLSETMREAVMLKGEVRSIATHGRMTGAVLTVLPLIIAAIMAINSPGYLNVLLRHPNGKDFVAAAIICLVAAHLVIRKMVDIKL